MTKRNEIEISDRDEWIDLMDTKPHPEDEIVKEQLRRYDEESRKFNRKLRKMCKKKPVDNDAIRDLIHKHNDKMREITLEFRGKYDKSLWKGGV